jgi:hypothetical protein
VVLQNRAGERLYLGERYRLPPKVVPCAGGGFNAAAYG